MIEVITHAAPGTPKAHPVLFVHGAWHGAWCWEEYFAPYFSAHGYATTSFSLRGHGGSAGRNRLFFTRLSDFFEDLSKVLNSFDRPPVLIGHSMGGLLVLNMLERRDDIPAAAVLAPIPVRGTVGLAWRTAIFRPLTALTVMTTWDVYRLVARPCHDGRTFFHPRTPPEQAEAYNRRFTRESFVAVGINALLPRRTRPVGTPLCVIGGEHDTLFTPGEIRATARAYGTEAVFFDMGHELMLEPGWQDVADHILSWLKLIAPDHWHE